MDIFFGTVVRAASIPKAGELIKLSWDTKEVLNRSEMVPENPSLEGYTYGIRGGPRGCKGIEVSRDFIIAANYHTLKIYDLDLKWQRDISHGLMVDLHEVHLTCRNTVWVTSTGLDAVLEFDLNSGEIVDSVWPRENLKFQKTLGIVPMKLDKEIDQRTHFLNGKYLKSPSHLHLNAVFEFRGELYGLMHSKGIIANLRSGEVLVEDENLKVGHNLLIMDEGVIVANDTINGRVNFYDLENHQRVSQIDIHNFNWIKRLKKWTFFQTKSKELFNKALYKLGKTPIDIAHPIFLRGLTRLDDHLFIGLSPSAILCINYKTGELIDAYLYSLDVQSCVHGLKVMMT